MSVFVTGKAAGSREFLAEVVACKVGDIQQPLAD
jgi:hypothetical protein